jgi:hypothetical protein
MSADFAPKLDATVISYGAGEWDVALNNRKGQSSVILARMTPTPRPTP